MEIIKSQKGFLTILLGKPDMGKSTLSIYDCAEHLRDNEKALYFTYEYCQSIVFNKLISHFHLKWQELYKLKVLDSNGVPLELLCEYVTFKRPDLDIVYVDYLDLVAAATYDADSDKEANIQAIVAKLADLAKQLNIAIILLSQVGAETSIEKTVEHLNNLTAFIEKPCNVIKMFIAKGNFVETTIDYGETSQIILVDKENNLKHFSSVNIKLLYND